MSETSRTTEVIKGVLELLECVLSVSNRPGELVLVEPDVGSAAADHFVVSLKPTERLLRLSETLRTLNRNLGLVQKVSE